MTTAIASTLNRTQAPAISEMGPVALRMPEAIRLPSGLTVALLDDPQGEDVVRLSLVGCGGSAEAPVKVLPSLEMSQLMAGTRSMSGEEITDLLEYAGAWVNHRQGFHHRILTLSTISGQLERMLPLYFDMFAHPAFPDNEFEKARAGYVSSIRVALRRNSFLASRLLNEITYGAGHPLARIVSPEDVEALTTADAAAFHTSWLDPRLMTLFVAGRVGGRNLDAILRDADTFAARLSATGASINVRPFAPASPSGEMRSIEGAPGNQASIQIAVPLPEGSHPDFPMIRLAVVALGGYFGSRLMSNIREEKGYTYGIQAVVSRKLDGNSMVISTDCDRSYVDAVLEEIDREIRGLVERPLLPDELSRLKSQCRTSAAREVENILIQMNQHISAITDGVDPSQFATTQALLDTVTAADIALAAERYLVGAPRFTAIAGR